MRQATADLLRELLAGHTPPCISLYQPTHRARSEQDPIRYRTLLKQIEKRS